MDRLAPDAVVVATTGMISRELHEERTRRGMTHERDFLVVGGMGHACEMETSIMLHLYPDRVKLDRAVRDGPTHTDVYRQADMQYGRPVFFVNEFHEVTKSGVMGHPDLASAEKGKRFLDGIVEEVSAFVEHFLTW